VIKVISFHSTWDGIANKGNSKNLETGFLTYWKLHEGLPECPSVFPNSHAEHLTFSSVQIH